MINHMPDGTSPADPFLELLNQHARATAVFDAVLASVTGEQLTRQTPCADWNLQALLEHQYGQNLGLSESIRTGSDDLEIWRPRPLGERGPAAVIDSAAELTSALREPPSGDYPVWMPEISPANPFTLAQVTGFHLIDTVVHAWDAARPLRRSLEFDHDIVVAVWDAVEVIPDGPQRDRPRSAFARRLPGSDERGLAGIMRSVGRDPSWSLA